MTDDESGESMEPMEEVPLIQLGAGRIGEISAWLTEGSRELIPETRGNILEETICYSSKRRCRSKSESACIIRIIDSQETAVMRNSRVDLKRHNKIKFIGNGSD